MKANLLFLGLVSLLSACDRIELSVSQTPIQDQDFPYKTYQIIGNTCQATDGGLVTVLVGTGSNRPVQFRSTNSYLEHREITVVKTDLQGQLQWTKLAWVGYTNSYKPFIHPMSDGGFAVFPWFQQYNPNISPVILRLSSTGDVVSQQSIIGLQGTDGFSAQNIISLPDKGFVISGRTLGGSPNLVLLRFNAQAQLLWNRKYEQSLAKTNTVSMAATSDGGMIVTWTDNPVVTGTGNTGPNQDETYLMKTAADGQQSWFKKYARFGFDPVISESNDKGYILLAKAYSISTNPPNFISQPNLIIYKLDKEATVEWSKLYSLSVSPYVTPRGIFRSGDTYVALYLGLASWIELLTIDLSGAELNRQRINDSSYSDNNILRLADGAFVYNGLSSPGQFSLTKTKPDKTLHWTVPIATIK